MLASLHGNVSPVWPATGLSIWLLIVRGRGLWPAVAVGAFAANALTDVPLGVAVAIAAGNTLEAVAGAGLWRRLQERWRGMPELRDLSGCLVASLLGPVASATIGVASLLIAGAVPESVAGKLWVTWWTGDALGALTVLPVLLAGPELGHTLRTWSAAHAGKAALVVAAAVGVIWCAFLLPSGEPFLFAIFPVLLLAMTWFGPAGARGVALLISAAGIAAAFFGHGPFATGEANQDLLNLQVFLAAVTITALVLPVLGAGRSSRLSVAVLLAGWMLSGWIFATSQRENLRSKQELFRERVAAAEVRIRTRMANYMDALQGGVSLFAASKAVERAEWRAYVLSLRMELRYPGGNRIGVIYAVPDNRLADWLAHVRTDGAPDFTIHPVPGGDAPPLAAKYVVTYLEPAPSTDSVLGLDIATETKRRQAAEAARDSGGPWMTSRISLVTANAASPSFVLYQPFYRHGARLETVADRRAAHEGWVYAPFVTKNLLDQVLGEGSEMLQLYFFEAGEMDQAHLLYASAGSDNRTLPHFERMTELELAGQRFQLGWRRGPKYPGAGNSPMVWVAASSALATLLLAGLVMSLQTMRQRAERLVAERTAELEHTHSLTLAALESTTDAILVVNRAGKIITCNRNFTEMWRLPEAVLAAGDDARALGLALEQLAEPSRFIAKVQELYDHPEQESFDTLEFKDGRIIERYSRPQRIQEQIVGRVWSFRDITARRQAAATLASTAELLERTGALAKIGGWEVDLQTMKLSWSRQTFLIAEIDSSVEPPLAEGINLFAPEARPTITAAVQAAIDHGTPYDLELPLITAKGRHRWVHTQGYAQMRDGKAVRLFGTFQDITERKQAESALKLSEFSVQQASLATYWIARDAHILRVNRAACELLGYAEAELLTLAITDLDPDFPVERWPAHWQELRARRRMRFETRQKHRDGHLINVEVDLNWFEFEGQEYNFAFIRDITERKELEENLAQSRDQALEASRLKSEFLANMSHEIRTPMNGIIGMSGLLMDTRLSPDQREMAYVVQNSAESLLTIINDILDFSKIEAGKLRMEQTEFELRPLVEETLTLLAPRAHEKHLELLGDFDARLEAMLFGDAGRLRQVLLNLIGNAIKFTLQGEVEVSVRWLQTVERQLTFRVEIKDTGIGMSPATRERLFQPFMQGDGSATRRFGGTGLGLAISRQLVDLMGGEIGFTSEEGRGSTFWFQLSLPVRDAHPKPLAPLPADLRILVVDDNATNRRVVLGQLAGFGLQAEAVTGATEALNALRAAVAQHTPYQLALLDWHMPDMDGMALAKAIRADANLRNTMLLMLTSGMTLTEPQALEEVRFEALLNKPVRAVQLHRAIRQALGHEHPEEKPPTAPATLVAPRGLQLLVAEDNETNQLVIQRLLEKMGCQMDFANNGAEAVRMVAQKTYDAVLMDCQMPIMDGYTATQHIRTTEATGLLRHLPVIALTAYAMPGDRKKCLDAGMDDYLSKPLREEELRRALQKCGVAEKGLDQPAFRPEPTVNKVLNEHQITQLRGLPGRRQSTLLEEVIELFTKETPLTLETLRQQAGQREPAETARLAHRLAGSCANLGGTRMRAAALAVEQAANTQAWAELPDLLNTLDQEWASLEAALRQIETKGVV